MYTVFAMKKTQDNIADWFSAGSIDGGVFSWAHWDANRADIPLWPEPDPRIAADPHLLRLWTDYKKHRLACPDVKRDFPAKHPCPAIFFGRLHRALDVNSRTLHKFEGRTYSHTWKDVEHLKRIRAFSEARRKLVKALSRLA